MKLFSAATIIGVAMGCSYTPSYDWSALIRAINVRSTVFKLEQILVLGFDCSYWGRRACCHRCTNHHHNHNNYHYSCPICLWARARWLDRFQPSGSPHSNLHGRGWCLHARSIRVIWHLILCWRWWRENSGVLTKTENIEPIFRTPFAMLHGSKTVPASTSAGNCASKNSLSFPFFLFNGLVLLNQKNKDLTA